MGWFVAACGVFAILGAVLEWDFFMNHRKAQFFTKLLGRNGTRAFYVVLGTGLVVLGVLVGLGIIQETKHTG